MKSRPKIKVESGFIALVCALLYFADGRLVFVYILSAIIHELGHILASALLKHSVTDITLSLFGAQISICGQTSYWEDFILSLSGPSSNGLAVALCVILHRFPLFAAVNLLLGLFNLLPILPLDGGNAMKACFSLFAHPVLVEQICRVVSVAVALALTIFGGVIVFGWQGSGYLLLFGLWLSYISLKEVFGN